MFDEDPFVPSRRNAIASVGFDSSAVAHGVEILQSFAECITGLNASGRVADASEVIPALLVAIGDFDCGILWAVEDGCLVQESIAVGNRVTIASSEMAWLESSRLNLEELGLEAAAVSDADLAVTGLVGSGGPMERALGPLTYAAAVVASRSHPTFLLQAISLDRRLADADLDLLLTFAELSAALILGSRATALLHLCRKWARAGKQANASHATAGHSGGDAPNVRRTAGRNGAAPVDHYIDPRLTRLSVREREVLTYALTGAPYDKIADALAISVATVKSHISSILHKLEVPSRAQLIALFI